MGSANPHCLGADATIDRVPKTKRRAAFDPIAHRRASAEELARRPLPATNVPPTTLPLPPPPATSVVGAPSVTSVEQVIPAHTLRRVRQWMRQLRRCLRFAAHGNYSMARRIRPDDLWLPHESNSMPETAAWNYDLRPLAAGGCGVPFAPSDGETVRPAGPMATDAVREAILHASVGFADKAIVSEIRQGITDDAMCARGSLLCAPHAGALKLYAQAREKLTKNEQQGWACGGFELPCWPIRASPYSVVDESTRAGEPKYRLTNDLSWPHAGMILDDDGTPVESINGSMARERWPRNSLPRAAMTGEAAAILQTSGAPVKLWGLDGEAYYRRFGRQRSELWRNAIAMLEGFQLDERCCFGSAADATKCSRASNLVAHAVRRALQQFDAEHPSRDASVIAWQHAREQLAHAGGFDAAETRLRFTALHAFSVYIDDGTAASINDLLFNTEGDAIMRDGVQLRRAQLHFETAVRALESLGHKSSSRKEQPPSDSVESLGLEIDVAADRMRILPDRLEAYARKVEQLLAAATCERDELISVLSKLLFAASCYPAGRPWLNAAWRVARASFNLSNNSLVPLSNRARDGLVKWLSVLRGGMGEGIPLAHGAFPSFGEAHVGAIYADASGNEGWSAWTVHGDELLLCHGTWTTAERGDDSFIIAEKELLASTLGLVSFGRAAGMRYVYSFTDNVVAMAAMRRKTPRSERMQRMCEARDQWMHQHGILEVAERITTKANLWADMGSRSAAPDVIRQAEQLGLRWRIVEVPRGWRRCYATLPPAGL